MAGDDTKGKKRKSAQDAAPKAKKARKSDDVAIAEPKPTRKSARKQAADEAAGAMDADEVPAPAPAPEPKKQKSKKSKAVEAEPDVSRPVAAVLDVTQAQEKPRKAKKATAAVVEEAEAPAPPEKAKKSKKNKQADAAPAEEDAAAEVEETAAGARSKKTKAVKKEDAPIEDVPEVVADDDDGEAVEDDQTAALLAGFSDSEDDEDDNDLHFDEDEKVPKLSAKAIKQAEDAPKSNQPGVIYVGRVPRGFFEPQMKKYFTQFGRVNKLRLSRNKKTGASKHYAFVEFQSQEVADIVARTMNNYLLFGHILKVHLIPTDQVHPDLFKGANQRFKVDPRNKKAGLEMERGVAREQWAKRVENEKSRRTNKAKELKELFDYEFEAPELKTVDSVPKQTAESQQLLEAPAEEAPAVEEPKAKKGKKGAKTQVEATPTKEATKGIETAQSAPVKKGKKTAKAPVEVEPTSVVGPTETTFTASMKKGKKGTKADGLSGATEEAPASEPTEPVADKKTMKDKKRKSDAAMLEAAAVTEETVSEKAPKSKKVKKTKEVEVEQVVEDVKEKKRKAKSEETVAKPKKAKKAKA